MTQFDALTLEILWQRLITVVDEMATTLVRTSFSTVVGAANDFGCEIMDVHGRSLAHAVITGYRLFQPLQGLLIALPPRVKTSHVVKGAGVVGPDFEGAVVVGQGLLVAPKVV